jgi:hypothetical protein
MMASDELRDSVKACVSSVLSGRTRLLCGRGMVGEIHSDDLVLIVRDLSAR